MTKHRSREVRFQRLGKLSDGPFPAFSILDARSYLEDFPDDPYAWLWLSITLVELARYEEAEQAINLALSYLPSKQYCIAFSQMGHLFRQRGDYDQAAVWHRKAIENAPQDATGYIYLGAVLAKQGRFLEAEAIHRTATKCSNGCIDEAFLNLGLVLRAQERFEEAAESFREAIRLDPKYRVAKQALRDVERCLKWQKRKS